jgi:uncharacterized protein (DUF1501 family)
MTYPRFVVVLLRGGLDGLSAVTPYGDRRLADLRPHLLLPEPGDDGGLLDLGGFWGLHPALVNLHALYAAGEMLAFHAVAGPYRTRSHFEALNLLETLAEGSTTGWLNRAAAALESGSDFAPALAVGAVQPPILLGEASVGSWVPRGPRRPSDGFYDALAALRSDEPAIARAVDQRRFADAALAGRESVRGTRFFELASVAGRLLAAHGGPRIALLESEGWDTHACQGAVLARALRELDHGLGALKSSLGDAWADTVALVMTEFGRTVRGNGTGGTDHGTGSVAFVLGGRVAGGAVRADWPGLAAADLYENRDLPPTTDLGSLAKGLLVGHLGFDNDALARVLPGSGPIATSQLLRHRSTSSALPGSEVSPGPKCLGWRRGMSVTPLGTM